MKNHTKENYIRHKYIQLKHIQEITHMYFYTNKQIHQDSRIKTLIRQHKPTIKILHMWTIYKVF